MDSTIFHVAGDPQLFVDNAMIECTQGLTRRWHKPQRHNAGPLIVADRPWEMTPYFTYSNHCVIRDPADGLFKCWYEDLGPLDGQGHPWRNRLLYAESDDGLTFRKPDLDVVAIDGRPTNIVMGYVDGQEPTAANPWANVGVHSNGIVIDPFPTRPEERFRTIYSRAKPAPQRGLTHSIECAQSSDGIHWRRYAAQPVLGSCGSSLSDVSCLHYDYDARMFVQNTRHGLMYSAALAADTPVVCGWFAPYYPLRDDLMNKRRVYQTRSHDFLHWSEPIPVSTPSDHLDNLDEAHYGMQQFRVGRMHFATLGVLRFVDNEMDVRLLYSRDGLQFLPCDRGNPFFACAGPGHWDAHMVSMTSQPITVGAEWWFYHGGGANHHDWWIGPPEGIEAPEARDPRQHVRFGLGLARLRQEGFVSLDALRQRCGYLITRPVSSPGRRLVINARCRKGGSIRAAVLDQANQPVGHCTLENADVFTGDAVAHSLTWGGRKDVPAPGSWRKLYLQLRDAEVFSFRFADIDEARS